MNRSRRFVTGLLGSYASIGINMLYTLASVPLALVYLDKEEFGLWALVTQLSSYLMLLEFGMSGSVARSLSDHKDSIETNMYGSILRTGTRVFAIQGLIVGTAGVMLAYLAPMLLNLPIHLHKSFTTLLAAQALLSGIKLSLGTLTAPLWCHQRLDLSSAVSSLSLIASFSVLWACFHSGLHIYSLTIASSVSMFLSIVCTYLLCRRLGFYPPRKYRGSYSPKIFRELFQFGGGIFLMNLGGQLASASQVILISRILGVENAAVWSISTKIYSMAQQFVARILDSSVAGLAEMAARHELVQLKKRYRDLLTITAIMAAATGSCIALTNGSFIQIWTSGKISWPTWNNLLLALILFISAVTGCLTTLPLLTKQFRWWKQICLLEGVIFVTFSILIVPRMGISGLLITALLAKLVTIGSYGIHYTATNFVISYRSIFGWVARPFSILLLCTALFIITSHPLLQNENPLYGLINGFVIFIFIILPSLLIFGIEPRLRTEAMSKIRGAYYTLKLKSRRL